MDDARYLQLGRSGSVVLALFVVPCIRVEVQHVHGQDDTPYNIRIIKQE